MNRTVAERPLFDAPVHASADAQPLLLLPGKLINWEAYGNLVAISIVAVATSHEQPEVLSVVVDVNDAADEGVFLAQRDVSDPRRAILITDRP
jgi:hypothetical protein